MSTILIIDDRQQSRDLLRVVLEGSGYEVVEAEDGELGLALARSLMPDLIITDVVMPRLDGYGLVRELLSDSATARIPVVISTAHYLHEEALPLAEACGVEHVLMKPVNPRDLLATVQRAMPSAPRRAELSPEFEDRYRRAVAEKLLAKIRELEDAHVALNRSETRYRTLADSSPVGILSLDAEGRCEYSNRRAQEIAGRPGSGLLGSWWEVMVDAEDREAVHSEVTRALGWGTESRVRFRLADVTPGGWVEARGVPTGSGGHTLALTDIGDPVVERERGAVAATGDLSAQRLDVLVPLARAIGRDFDSALSVTLAGARMAADGLAKVEAPTGASKAFVDAMAQVRGGLQQIERSGVRASRIARQLRIVGGDVTARPVVFAPNQHVQAMRATLEAVAGPSIHVEMRLTPDAWMVRMDPESFEQAVVLLVAHARQVLDGSGVVGVSTENVEDPVVRGGPGQGGRLVRIGVAVAGRPTDLAPRSFDPLTAGVGAVGTPALGLLVVRAVAEQAGGSAAVQSDVGLGVAATMSIPAVSRGSAEEAAERY